MEDKRRFTEEGDRIATAEPEAPKVKYKIHPRHEWVLIRQLKKEEERTEHGVIKPGADFFLMDSDDKSQRGQVVEASEKTGLKPGEYVIFTNYPIEIGGLNQLLGEDDLFLVRDEEVYARVEICPE
jgi:co-chaperonin GroES (HSP10)